MQRYQLVVDQAKVSLNLAACLGVWLMPGSMIKPKAWWATTISSNRQVLKWSLVSTMRWIQKSGLKPMAGGSSKFSVPKSHLSIQISPGRIEPSLKTLSQGLAGGFQSVSYWTEDNLDCNPCGRKNDSHHHAIFLEDLNPFQKREPRFMFFNLSLQVVELFISFHHSLSCGSYTGARDPFIFYMTIAWSSLISPFLLHSRTILVQ